MRERTEMQIIAQTENWSIHILKGFLRILHHTRPALKLRTYRAMEYALEESIAEIKARQAKRMRRGRRG